MRQQGRLIDLVMFLDGCSFADAVRLLTGDRPERQAPRPVPSSPLPTASSNDNRYLALSAWWSAKPIAGIIAERYLVETRRLVLPPDVSPRVLRFHPSCGFEGARLPCLLVLSRNSRQAIMRTALTPNARKIKRAALGPVGGAAIKLSDDEDVTTGLKMGEGPGTNLAGMLDGYTPAWA
jgi:hypothetical protein